MVSFPPGVCGNIHWRSGKDKRCFSRLPLLAGADVRRPVFGVFQLVIEQSLFYGNPACCFT
jgi:hypothetical protein